MRIVLDPVPIVVGIYAYVGEVLAATASRREDAEAATLGRRLARQRGQSGDREVQKMVRALHTDVKTADAWKISQETDLVELVVQGRGQEPAPQAYVLLKPREIRPVLLAIRAAAEGAGEAEETLQALEAAAEELEGRPADYLTFGFDPWEG
jgi:hypothetical protein